MLVWEQSSSLITCLIRSADRFSTIFRSSACAGKDDVAAPPFAVVALGLPPPSSSPAFGSKGGNVVGGILSQVVVSSRTGLARQKNRLFRVCIHIGKNGGGGRRPLNKRLDEPPLTSVVRELFKRTMGAVPESLRTSLGVCAGSDRPAVRVAPGEKTGRFHASPLASCSYFVREVRVKAATKHSRVVWAQAGYYPMAQRINLIFRQCFFESRGSKSSRQNERQDISRRWALSSLYSTVGHTPKIFTSDAAKMNATAVCVLQVVASCETRETASLPQFHQACHRL